MRMLDRNTVSIWAGNWMPGARVFIQTSQNTQAPRGYLRNGQQQSQDRSQARSRLLVSQRHIRYAHQNQEPAAALLWSSLHANRCKCVVAARPPQRRAHRLDIFVTGARRMIPLERSLSTPWCGIRYAPILPFASCQTLSPAPSSASES